MTNFPNNPRYNDTVVLKILAEANRPVLECEIDRVLLEIRHNIKRASVYNILKTLMASGFVEYQEGIKSDKKRGPAPGTYEITEKGRNEILEVQEQIRRMLSVTL